MIFLIEYDRDSGQMVSIERFQDVDRLKAQESRLQLELELNDKKIEHEVVLLEASSEDIVRRTHRRYFEGLRELANVPAA